MPQSLKRDSGHSQPELQSSDAHHAIVLLFYDDIDLDLQCFEDITSIWAVMCHFNDQLINALILGFISLNELKKRYMGDKGRADNENKYHNCDKLRRNDARTMNSK